MVREENPAELNTIKPFLYYIQSIVKTHFGEAILRACTGRLQEQPKKTQMKGNLIFVTLPSRNPQGSTWAEAHRREWKHCGSQSMLEDHWTCWFCLYIRDSLRHRLPLCFDLSHSRAGISSMFHKMPCKSITGLCYLNTGVPLVKHTRLNGN